MTTRVLIADDQPDVRSALEALIRSEQSLELVGSAEDAAQAIELARVHQPDVALIDYRMPGGGPAAAAGIRSCSPSTAVVALSAHGDRGSVFEMLRSGAVGYLVKGAPAEEILLTIQRSNDGHGVLSSEVTAGVVHGLANELQRQQRGEQEQRENVARVRGVLTPGVLSIAYQPIVALQTGDTVGFEALARFKGIQPEWPPAEWFAVAADVGLRTELELAALELALTRLDSLPANSFLSVNVWPEALASPAVLERIGAAQPDRIVIEVTEHAAIDDYDRLVTTLADFRRRGGRLAIDDAGAGFASLRHVLRLDPDMIKVDGSLVRDIESDRAARALTRALVSFAREMGKLVVAEGIETASALDVLRELGIDYGQGYHLGRPAALPEITQHRQVQSNA
jgi:EAL domain-containing protein (putative c-di-GMP-specific phosphodiesterase class I)